MAANLRPTITALGSVVGLVAADTGMGAGALGLLGAVPLLAFAVVSPIVHVLTRAIGADRAVLVSTLVLIVATVVRSLPGSPANLWIGTVVMGAAIAVANVVLPELVKRDFPTEVPMVTGLYSTVLGATAAVASGLALPIAELGGWRLGIGDLGSVQRGRRPRLAATDARLARVSGPGAGDDSEQPTGGTAERDVRYGGRRWPGRCR